MTTRIACKTAADFMRNLSLANSEVWNNSQDTWHSRWIFRGQRDANWKLIPNAHRDPLPTQIQTYVDRYSPEIDKIIDFLLSMPVEISQKEPPGEYIVNGPARLYLEQNRDSILKLASITIAENTLAWMYADKLDSVGLYHSNQKIRFHPCDKDRISNWMLVPGGHSNPDPFLNLWEYSKYRETFILSQHHGLPTRLLDWTSRPYNAAFFAAEKVYKELTNEASSEKYICVWAIDSSAYMSAQPSEHPYQSFYRLDRPGLGASKYIHAQEGMFAYDPIAESRFLQYKDFTPMEPS